jgi:hypothetical protein
MCYKSYKWQWFANNGLRGTENGRQAETRLLVDFFFFYLDGLGSLPVAHSKLISSEIWIL